MAANITITGNLGRDPELRSLENGQMVTKFTVAARQGKVQGQDPPALWFTVEVWGQQALWIADNLVKGEGVCVSGRLALQTWTDRQSGEKREALTVKNAQVEKLWAPREGGYQGFDFAAAAAPPALVATPAALAAPVAPAAAPVVRAAPPRPAAAPPAAGSPFDDEPPY